MDRVDIVGVFLGAVAGMPHVPDHISGGDYAPFFQVKGVGKVLTQVGVVIISLAVKAADADAPAAVLIPAQGFHITGLNCHNGCTDLSHHVVPQVLSFVTIAS